MNREAFSRLAIYGLAILFIVVVWIYAFRAHTWSLWEYGIERRVDEKMREHVEEFHGGRDASSQNE